jgi:antitoxin Phd
MKTKVLRRSDAKAGLSAAIDNAIRGQICVITRHGKPEAVLLGYEQWKRLSQVPSFGRLLMALPASLRGMPKRNRGALRTP